GPVRAANGVRAPANQYQPPTRGASLASTVKEVGCEPRGRSRSPSEGGGSGREAVPIRGTRRFISLHRPRRWSVSSEPGPVRAANGVRASANQYQPPTRGASLASTVQGGGLCP